MTQLELGTILTTHQDGGYRGFAKFVNEKFVEFTITNAIDQLNASLVFEASLRDDNYDLESVLRDVDYVISQMEIARAELKKAMRALGKQ